MRKALGASLESRTTWKKRESMVKMKEIAKKLSDFSVSFADSSLTFV